MIDEDKPLTLFERAQVVAWELADATEDLNDALRGLEEVLREKGFRSAWAEVPAYEQRRSPHARPSVVLGHRLLWDGSRLWYDNRQAQTPLLHCSRETRKRAVAAIPALLKRFREVR